VIVVLTVDYWLLCLYPASHRDEFGEEMTSVFREAHRALPAGPAAKLSFYRHEFCGLLSGAVSARFKRLFGPAISFPKFCMQPQFRFPRSTVFLMLVIMVGIVLTIAAASNVAGDTMGSAWRTVLSVLGFMLLAMCTAAAVVWGILHALRRSGTHRIGGPYRAPTEQR
jgi:hypothetical protein